MRALAPILFLAVLLPTPASAAEETFTHHTEYPCYARVEALPGPQGAVPCPLSQGERFVYTGGPVSDMVLELVPRSGQDSMRLHVTVDFAGGQLQREFVVSLPTLATLTVTPPTTGTYTLRFWPDAPAAVDWTLDTTIRVHTV